MCSYGFGGDDGTHDGMYDSPSQKRNDRQNGRRNNTAKRYSRNRFRDRINRQNDWMNGGLKRMLHKEDGLLNGGMMIIKQSQKRDCLNLGEGR